MEFNVFQYPTDNRKVKGITLRNGLEVILISQPESHYFVMSMAIGAGSYQDTVEIKGLFNFMQHLLFFGSKNYPKMGDLIQTIASYGGLTNGYTMSEQTVYYAYATNPSLKEIASRLADIFKNPLFPEKALEKELISIIAEDNMYNTGEDHKRIMILKTYIIIITYIIIKFLKPPEEHLWQGRNAIFYGVGVATQFPFPTEEIH